MFLYGRRRRRSKAINLNSIEIFVCFSDVFFFLFFSFSFSSVFLQYLEENVHQTYVDVGVMARHLQEKYREYTRRKAQPFRYLVDQGKRTRQMLGHSISDNLFFFFQRESLTSHCLLYIYVFFSFYRIAAYKTVLHSYGLDSNPSTDDEENSDIELMDVSFVVRTSRMRLCEIISILFFIATCIGYNRIWKSHEQYADHIIQCG